MDIKYSHEMTQLLKLPNDLTSARGMTLISTAGRVRTGITELIAALILQGPLFVVAGSEWLPAFELTRIVRKNTLEVKETLRRLHTARASTCYRLFDSLANLPITGEPILVLDFFHTFYEEDIPLAVRSFKLRQCCRELKRLAFYRPVVVMTQAIVMENCEEFIPILTSVADKTFSIEPELETVHQPVLF
jgi:hypothetical protein